MKAREAIRARTRPVHDRLEALPFAQDLAAARISRADYALLLAQLLHLHETLEALEPPPQLAPFHAACARAEHLRADQAALSADPQPLLPGARALAASLTAAADEPAELLGWLYVVAGSRLGASALSAPLARALGVEAQPGRGLDYHVVGADTFPRVWQGLLASLDGLLEGPGEVTRCAEAADDAMHRFYALYTELGANRAPQEPA